MNTRLSRRCLRPQQRIININRPSIRWNSSAPIVQIENATFYRNYPSPTTTTTTETSSTTTTSEASSTSSNPPIFPNLSFTIANNGKSENHRRYWAVISTSSLARTTFLQVLNNQYLSIPPNARSYPYLSSHDIQDPQFRNPERAIKYVGFDAEREGLGGTSLKGAYLSARYEARKEETDWTLQEYLEGNTDLNPLETTEDKVDRALLEDVVRDLKLKDLLTRQVSNLSNGQTRRAKIAKTLLTKPELLLLDGPFMGLDPNTVEMLSNLLKNMAFSNAPRIVLSLRPEDVIPDWISSLVCLKKTQEVMFQGTKQSVFEEITRVNQKTSRPLYTEEYAVFEKMRLTSNIRTTSPSAPVSDNEPISRDGFPKEDPPNTTGEAIVEMQGVKVSYASANSATRSTVLGAWQQPDQDTPGLHWSIHRGQRWGIFGPNGSGKTTLLSLITSDHPQAYSLPIKHFGRSRLPTPGETGISIFELQKRMGHSSPEVHTFFPKHLTLRRVLESAWADTPMSKPKLSHLTDRTVDAFLLWFSPELSPNSSSPLGELTLMMESLPRILDGRVSHKRAAAEAEVHKRIVLLKSGGGDLDWADTLRFRDLSFSQQRLALFLRAIIASPDLVILDEAFSGIDEAIRDKCLLFLSRGERTEWATIKEKKSDGKIREVKALKPTLLSQHEGAVVFEGLSESQALLVISHSKEDVPGAVREWICLPEPGEDKPARWGKLNGPLELNPHGWAEIWGTSNSESSE